MDQNIFINMPVAAKACCTHYSLLHKRYFTHTQVQRADYPITKALSEALATSKQFLISFLEKHNVQ